MNTDWLPLSMMPKTALPVCLPQALLDDLKLQVDPDFYSELSVVYGRAARVSPMRHLILRHYVLALGDAYTTIDETWAGHNDNDWSLPQIMPNGCGSTHLQLAVRLYDVPFVYECIRLGADVNHSDVKGRTPLFCAMNELLGFSLDLATRQLRHNGTEDESLTVSTISRLRHVAQILVEQHADVNLVPYESPVLSPFVMARAALDLELLELLALHGAAAGLDRAFLEGPPSQLDTWVADPSRASACTELMARLASRTELPARPPRKCPCFSGKSLSECHETGDHPYPPTFACICRSAKTYANCCKLRNIELVERWDEERGRMKVTQRMMEADGHTATYIPFSTVNTLMSAKWPDTGKKKSSELVLMAIEHNDTESEVKADPAFRYVATQLEYLPMPEGSEWYPKDLGKFISTGWNSCVDKYIASGQDTRSVPTIERAAKLDPFFLPSGRDVKRPGVQRQSVRGSR
ncbi:uncharacterized protein B0H18DRAFT_158812 [Fomitopsis serialis]|uniref:uncharacterized protein n=1 Tax=Fomitopsis serialis TaxID=139415 RepID=UPI002007CA26|nr:uncharacterized protein B0H18DRAFT_158812 [Neoantrodia serialis]KAH9929998.1 hypothetical protein B0H18DRAFT_158812 [Neoantrodia serialis]